MNNGRCNEYCKPKKLAIFEVEDKHGANLESCYENLNSIPLVFRNVEAL
jgi:hypothetical protein